MSVCDRLGDDPVQATTTESETSVGNDPASPVVVQGSGNEPVQIGDARAVRSASGGELENTIQREDADMPKAEKATASTRDSRQDKYAGISVEPVEASLDLTEEPPTPTPEAAVAAAEVSSETRHGLHQQSLPATSLMPQAVAVVSAEKEQPMLAESANEETPDGFEDPGFSRAEAKPEVTRVNSAVAAGPAVAEGDVVSPTTPKRAFAHAATKHDGVAGSSPAGVASAGPFGSAADGDENDTYDSSAGAGEVTGSPGEVVSHTEAGRTPTEESAPIEKRGRVGSPVRSGNYRVSDDSPTGVVGVVGSTGEGMVLSEEDQAPTEESAPTEERGRAGSPIGFSSLERDREQRVRMEIAWRVVRVESCCLAVLGELRRRCALVTLGCIPGISVTSLSTAASLPK